MPILTAAIDTDFQPALLRSSRDVSNDFGKSEDEQDTCYSASKNTEDEVHRKIIDVNPSFDVTMSALSGNFLSLLSISKRPLTSANELILSEVLAQWEALSRREKDTAYQVSSWEDYLEYNRSKISNYFYSIIDAKELDRRLVSFALSYLKIFVERDPDRSRGSEHLAMLTSLYTAIKIHSNNSYENGKPTIYIAEVVEWSSFLFTARDVCRMEKSLLQALNYYVNPPVAQHFLDIIVPLIDDELIGAQVKQHIINISNWLCEVSVTDSFFMGVKPSSVAYAAILVAMDTSVFGESVKSWFESFDLKHDAYITLQCYERMYELYLMLDLPRGGGIRCHSPTDGRWA